MSRQQNQSSNPSPRPEDGDSNEPIEGDIPPRPKRPLTVFNLFGKLERNFIVQSSQKQIRSEFGNTEGNIFENVDSTAVDPYLELRPEKYRGIVSKLISNSNHSRDVPRFTIWLNLYRADAPLRLFQGWKEQNKEAAPPKSWSDRLQESVQGEHLQTKFLFKDKSSQHCR
jgi:hypothetical protein